MAKRRASGASRKRSGGARKQKRAARKVAAGTRSKERVATSRRDAALVMEAWAPSPFALWAEEWDDPCGSDPSAILLRHPTAPFVARGPQIDETALHAIALSYLTQAKGYLPQQNSSLLKVFQGWLDHLEQENDLFFSWLTLRWPPEDFSADDAGNPLVSFRIDPTLPDGTKLPDDTIVLLAGEKILGVPLGSGHGIRVVAHTHTDEDGVEVRITGMSASVPPFVVDAGNELIAGQIAFISAIVQSESARDALRAEMALSAGLSDSSAVQIQGVRIAQANREQRTELQATVGVTAENPTPYSGVFRLQEGSLALISKVDLVADATTPGDSGVFLIDPASQGSPADIIQRRPTRPEDVLNKRRQLEHITNGQNVPLNYPTPASPEEVVVVCPGFSFEDKGLPQGTAKTVDLPGDRDIPEVRSNDFAAVSAYWNVEQLFLRLAAYGLNNSTTNSYFRIAKLPLKVRYRSGVRPGRGKDGKTVNARVVVDGWKSDFVGPTPPGARPELTIHCALGNLSTRERKPWTNKWWPGGNQTQSPAEPLGIAADPRWMWHEIGHVLLMACVGYLQFPFAHSAGDALAAVVGDAESTLARGDASWRGATFPWVFIPRRHDRSVLQGWSWAGSMHYAAAQVPPSAQLRRKGYWSEQILSSSLFRLYRCIGGDTDPDPGNPDARQSASHYTVYLIMRGIQIYGTYGVLSRTEPDHLVTALMDADVGTGLWNVAFPFPRSLQFHRVGGCVHKVIRWAFEAQGLYGPTLRNAPGLPPPVDIYIRDLRPTVDETPYGDIDYGEGSYVPVSLHCNPTAPAPLWQAHPDAITLSANGDISVTVGNRGTRPANNVGVDVWWCPWPLGQPTLPPWRPASWMPCASPGNPLQNINPGDSKTFAFFAAPASAGNRYLLLARATCADDPANIDQTGLPCSKGPTPLIDLVANDNNLGLRVVGP